MPQLGPYTLYTIETGRFGLDGGAMFGVVPKPLWEKRIAPDERNRIPLAMRCLLLEGNDRLILIDTGLGDTYTDKFADIFAIDHEHSELHRSLEAAGVSAADITDVVLTHLHFDHGGGCTTRRNGMPALTFPNATHYVQRAHWDWAQNPNPREKNSFLEENLAPLASTAQLHLLDGDGPLFDNVAVRTVFGHTEAQQLVKIDGDGQTLVFVADLLPTTAHVPLPYVMGYDVRPLQTIKEKEAFLNEAHAEGWHLFFEHDPEVAVANLQEGAKGLETTNHRPLTEL